MNKIISFPYLGYYSIALEYFLVKMTKCKIIIPPCTDRRAICLGSKYAPSLASLPFKYSLGSYIEALEDGATVLMQSSWYGYYAHLQEKILRDMGYDFDFYNLTSDNHISLILSYKFCKKMNRRTNPISYLYYLINSLLMIIFMDNIEKYIRLNMGFEINKGEFEKLEKEYLASFKGNGIIKNIYLYIKYKKEFKKIQINKTGNIYRVALLGEAYFLMDSNASFNIERKLIKRGIEVSRYMDLTYLLITKRFRLKSIIRRAKKYIKYNMGDDASETIYFSEQKAKEGYDGIIHLKSFGYIPEVSASSILSLIEEDYDIPILQFSFNDDDNETLIDTKIEDFCDMIKARKEKKIEH